CVFFFFFQAEDGIRDRNVTGVQTCALPILHLRRIADWWVGDEQPALVSHPPIRYPPEMQSLRVDGTVLVEAALDVTGHVEPGSRSEERRVGKGGRSERWRGERRGKRRSESS